MRLRLLRLPKMQKLRDGMGFPCGSPRGANLIVPWVTLGAIPVRTDRMRIGTMITPVSRRRPWKLAGETVTVDHLSNGRVILSVGLGALDTGFAEFGEETDRKARAQLLDEGLDIITGLSRGSPSTTTASITRFVRPHSNPGHRRCKNPGFPSGWWEPGPGPDRCSAPCATMGSCLLASAPTKNGTR